MVVVVVVVLIMGLQHKVGDQVEVVVHVHIEMVVVLAPLVRDTLAVMVEVQILPLTLQEVVVGLEGLVAVLVVVLLGMVGMDYK